MFLLLVRLDVKTELVCFFVFMVWKCQINISIVNVSIFKMWIFDVIFWILQFVMNICTKVTVFLEKNSLTILSACNPEIMEQVLKIDEESVTRYCFQYFNFIFSRVQYRSYENINSLGMKKKKLNRFLITEIFCQWRIKS